METIIVTGSTGAVGGAAVKMLRDKGYNVIATTRRTPEEGQRYLDISSVASIKQFVDGLKADGIRVDGLLNNAGTMQRDFGRNADGFERVTGTNYVGTYLLSRLMLPLMNEGGRIANTVSLTCYTSKFDKTFFDVTEKNYSQLGTYGNTKMAVMLFTEELAQRCAGKVRVNATDPGVVNSRMIHMDRWFDPIADALFRPFCKKPEGGAQPAVNAVTAEFGGQLFRGNKHQDFPKNWIRPELSQWLWEETERRIKQLGIEIQ